MPHEIEGVNKENFIENLAVIFQKFTEPTDLLTDDAFNGLLLEHRASELDPTGDRTKDRLNAVLTGQFIAVGETEAEPVPTSWDDLILTFRKESEPPLSFLPIGNLNPRAGDAFDGFVSQYRDILSIETGDWSNLQAQGVTDDDIKGQFVNAFDHFIKDKKFTDTLNFFNQWYEFLTVTAVLKDTTAPGALVDIASYERFFLNLGFDVADFPQRLKAFYDKKLLETGGGDVAKGFFIRSFHFDEWTEEIWEEHLDSISKAPIITDTSVSKDSTKKLLAIDRIFLLLIDMIDTINNLSATQAARLTILADWQRKYTDKIEQLPIITDSMGVEAFDDDQNINIAFLQDAPNPLFWAGVKKFGETEIKTDSDEFKKIIETERSSFSTKIQSLIERIRGQRDAIKDDAKSLQTNISQSQDAANAQTNIGTALLQELGTLLSAIFR